MLEMIYYIGAAGFALLGLLYAAVGLFERGVPLIGRSSFADSVFGRVFVLSLIHI